MTVRLVIDGAVAAEMLRGPNGMVMRDLVNRATRVQLAARSQAKGKHGSGRLAADITKRVAHEGVDPKIMVGAWNTPYALFVHEGTAQHWIYPRKTKALHFFWPRGGMASADFGGWVFFKKVHHPGTSPNPYLADQLHLAIE